MITIIKGTGGTTFMTIYSRALDTISVKCLTSLSPRNGGHLGLRVSRNAKPCLRGIFSTKENIFYCRK